MVRKEWPLSEDAKRKSVKEVIEKEKYSEKFPLEGGNDRKARKLEITCMYVYTVPKCIRMRKRQVF